MRRDDQKRTSTETLNCYYTVFQWKKLRLILNLQWIIGLQSQSINFTNEFDQVDITIGEPVLIELTRYLKSDKEKCDVFIRLNKSLYGQVEAARLWYEKFLDGLLDCGFVVIKVDP